MSEYGDDIKDYIQIILFLLFVATFLYFYIIPIFLFIENHYEDILFFFMLSAVHTFLIY